MMKFRDEFLAAVIISLAIFPTPAESRNSEFKKPEFDSFHFKRNGWVELSCLGDGNFQVNTTWSKDDAEISENSRVVTNGGKLTIRSELNSSDSGVYRCKQCDISNCTTHSHLVYVLRQTDIRVIINTKAIIYCELAEFFKKHNVEHHTSWLFTGADTIGFVDSRDPIHGQNDVLILDPVSYANGGLLDYSVYSYFRQHRYLIRIDVLSNSKEPSSTSASRHKFVLKNIGSNVMFSFSRPSFSDNDKRSDEIIWTKNDKPLNSVEEDYILENLTPQDSGVYKATFGTRSYFRYWLAVGSVFKKTKVLSNVSLPFACDPIFKDYSGIDYSVDFIYLEPTKTTDGLAWQLGYTCIVSTDLFGEFNETFYIISPKKLDVKRVASRWTRQLFEGDYHKFSCEEMSDMNSTVSWIKVESEDEKIYSNDWTMRLDNLTETDSGEYICVVCHQFGCFGKSHWLFVLSPTGGYNLGNEFYEIEANSDIVMTCIAKHYSFIKKITWWKESQETPRSIYDFDMLDFTGHSHQLLFEKVSHQYTGVYGCTVETYFTQPLMHTFNLTVKDTIEEKSKFETLIPLLIIVLIAFLCILLVVIGLIILYRKKYIVKRVINAMIPQPDSNEAEFQEPNLEIELTHCRTSPTYGFIFPFDEKWEIARPVLGPKLGEGQFGTVHSADLNGVQVAVKQLKDDCNSNEEVLSFCRELEIMKKIGEHSNIVRLCGCCSQGGPLLIVTEYAPQGNLRNFLLRHRIQQPTPNGYQPNSPALSVEQLVRFAHQVAQGMEYLASIKYIHRDLAARNVLVFDNGIVKISDFGLSRGTCLKEYYRRATSGLLPAGWMAPESLQREFYNSQSDVWSFGVLFWEVMTLGEDPHLMLGRQLHRPALCPDDVYSLMSLCWCYEPDERPTFSELVQLFEHLNLETPEPAYDRDSEEESETEV